MVSDPIIIVAIFIAFALGGILKGATGAGAPIVTIGAPAPVAPFKIPPNAKAINIATIITGSETIIIKTL